MTPHLLRTTGEALYGPQWQSAIARDLDVSDRTVRRWVRGDAIPSYVAAELEHIARERVHALVDLVSHLSQQSIPGFVHKGSAMVKTDSATIDQLCDPERVA